MFTVPEGEVLQTGFEALMFEGGGGDSMEVAILDRFADNQNDLTDFGRLLGDGVFGWKVLSGSATPMCDPDTLGDVDDDGTIAFEDFQVLSANYGRRLVGHDLGDVDCNGRVAFADFLVLSANYHTSPQGVVAVPEPHELLCFVAVAFLGIFRRAGQDHPAQRRFIFSYGGRASPLPWATSKSTETQLICATVCERWQN